MDTEGTELFHFRRNSILLRGCRFYVDPVSAIYLSISKGLKLLCKKTAVAGLFLALEVTSYILDFYGKGNWRLQLLSLLVSLLGFGIVVYIHMKGRATTAPRPSAEKQVMALEVGISATQLVGTTIRLVRLVLHIKKSLDYASAIPLVCAIFLFLVALKDDGLDTDSSRHKDLASTSEVSEDSSIRECTWQNTHVTEGSISGHEHGLNSSEIASISEFSSDNDLMITTKDEIEEPLSPSLPSHMASSLDKEGDYEEEGVDENAGSSAGNESARSSAGGLGAYWYDCDFL